MSTHFIFHYPGTENLILEEGYILRRFGTTFTDWNAEWRFPVDGMYKLDNHQVIVGMYKPLRMRRTFAAIGVHAKIQKQTHGSKKVTHYALGLTAIPSYVFAAPLDDKPYGTTGLILAYEPVLFSQIKENGKKETKALTGHRVRAGGHLDIHLQTNDWYQYQWLFYQKLHQRV